MSSRPRAACVAVGSELLGEHRLDRNSLRVTALLARYGVAVVEKRVVGDSVERIADAVRELLAQVEVVVVTGGLGPTADDVTRPAVASALDRSLRRDPEIVGWLHERYAAYGREMPDVALRMADVVEGSRVLANTRGSAPGMLISLAGRLLVVLPGVPGEMAEMLERDLGPELSRLNPGVRRVTRILLLGGVYESDVEARIAPLYDRFGRDNITILANCGVVRLVLSAAGDEAEAALQLSEMEGAFRARLEDDVAGVDVAGLEEVVLSRLRDRGQTLAAAESCTGGLLGARLTSVAGASDSFEGGVVSYSNRSKERLLEVPGSLLESRGAVSEEVAREMAQGVRRHLGADWGVGITGIAGPGGGTEEKPVGLVHWAVASARRTVARSRVFPGDRESVRVWSVHSVLDLLRREMAEGGDR